MIVSIPLVPLGICLLAMFVAGCFFGWWFCAEKRARDNVKWMDDNKYLFSYHEEMDIIKGTDDSKWKDSEYYEDYGWDDEDDPADDWKKGKLIDTDV